MGGEEVKARSVVVVEGKTRCVVVVEGKIRSVVAVEGKTRSVEVEEEKTRSVVVEEEKTRSVVVEDGDSGLSTFISSILHRLLLCPRMKSIEKLDRLLFSPMLLPRLQISY